MFRKTPEIIRKIDKHLDALVDRIDPKKPGELRELTDALERLMRARQYFWRRRRA